MFKYSKKCGNYRQFMQSDWNNSKKFCDMCGAEE